MAGNYATLPQRHHATLHILLCVNAWTVQASGFANINSMWCTCRELLLAFVWLLVHDSVLQCVLKQKVQEVSITSLLPPYPVVSFSLLVRAKLSSVCLEEDDIQSVYSRNFSKLIASCVIRPCLPGAVHLIHASIGAHVAECIIVRKGVSVV